MIKRILTLALISMSLAGYTQKIKVTEGSFAPLKGQKSIKTEFTYNDMTIGKDGLAESAYVEKRKGELNTKEAGRGDRFASQWVADRNERFEPQFRELFSKHANLSTVDEKASYTLVFHTTRTEPGWNVGVMRVPAYIDAEVLLVETGNPNNVVAKATLIKAPGRDAMGFDYETGARLQEAYAKAGKELGQLVAKQTK
jgi:hypothetical protein